MSSPRGRGNSGRGSRRGPSSRGGRSRGGSSTGRGRATPTVAAPDFNFYEIEVEDGIKIDTSEIGRGKIWFVKFLHEDNKVKKLLRMYSSHDCAKDLQLQEGVSVYEYTPPYADKDSDESQYTLIIPIGGVLRHNPALTKTDFYQAMERVLNIINGRFGLAPNNAVRMHVSILPASENFTEPTGKIFINFEQIWSEEKIAKLREILCGMTWMLDCNDITGYCHYMKCLYSKKKKEDIVEECGAVQDSIIPQRPKKEDRKSERNEALKKVKKEKKVTKRNQTPSKESKDAEVADVEVANAE